MRRGTDADSRIRVLCVVPNLDVGGAERHMATLLVGLDRTRFAPELICLGHEGPLFATLPAGAVPARALHRTRRQALSTLVELVRHMRRTRPDVVITRSYNAEVLGRAAAVLARVPARAVWVHSVVDIRPRSRLRRITDRLLEPFTTSYFGVAHGQLPYLTDVLRIPARKIQVVHHGVDLARWSPRVGAVRDREPAASLGVGADDLVVGCVAVLRPEKDHTTVLRAWVDVVAAVPRALLLLVGDGPRRAELERLAGELGVADRVRFTGARADVGDVLRALDVFVLASVTEAFPMSVLEAMATGVPTVCTAVGGIPEMVDDGRTGFLCPVGDPAGLADRLVTLLGDEPRRREMGAAARRRAEAEFGLERSIGRSEQMIATSAARGRRGRSDGPVRMTVVLDRTGVGGAETMVLELFRHFDPAVVHPRLVCLKDAGELGDDFERAGFPVEVLGKRSRYDLRAVLRLRRTLVRTGTDVVLVPHYARASLTLGRLAARSAGIRSVVAVHGMDLTRYGQRCLPRHDLETLFASDALAALGPLQAAYLRDEEGVGTTPWRRIRIEVIPNGIRLPEPATTAGRDAARAELGLAAHEVAIGIVGRLRAEKAHDVLLRAVAELAPRAPDVRLVVIGDGERRDELEKLAGQLGIADRVQFTGLRRDVPALLPGLDVACLCSMHEAAPLALIESMAAGLPVVATRTGGIPDLVEDGTEGELVPVGDVAALADALDRVVRDPDLRARYGRAGRARAERDHSITETAARYQRLVRSLVAR